MRRHIKRARMVAAVLFLASSPLALGHDLELAPPAFDYAGQKAVPVDFQRVDLNLVFNAAARTVKARARIEFNALEAGFPMLDLVPNATVVKLNGTALTSADFPAVADPDGVTKVRVLKSLVAADSANVLELEYALTEGVTFGSGTVKAGFFMSDLAVGGREYFEQYGPANFEFDQYPQSITTELQDVNVEHKIYANGEVFSTGTNQWRVEFPEYFTTSSFFFHLTPSNAFQEEQYAFAGREATIPVTVYAADRSLVTEAVAQSKQVLTELEGTFGAFAHDRLVIYVTPGGGGMEYCGGTMTSIWALGHELTHSWFARGVMPADGNAGWIDEAVASWRDNGFPRASSGPSGFAVNLGGFSPYRRHTTDDAYNGGAKLISQFDQLFSSLNGEGQTGMRWILRNLFAQNKRTTISVQNFQAFLETFSGRDLDAIFQEYVYGGGALVANDSKTPKPAIKAHSHHPRPYTKAELVRFR